MTEQRVRAVQRLFVIYFPRPPTGLSRRHDIPRTNDRVRRAPQSRVVLASDRDNWASHRATCPNMSVICCGCRGVLNPLSK